MPRRQPLGVSLAIRRTLGVLPMLLSGCFHNWVLEHQCHKIKVGMTFAEAYRTVSREPVCSYYTGRAPNEEVPACLEHRADLPWSVVWNSPVVGAESPDQCFMTLDANGHVASVHYSSGNGGFAGY
jgi:hypothetical protein